MATGAPFDEAALGGLHRAADPQVVQCLDEEPVFRQLRLEERLEAAGREEHEFTDVEWLDRRRGDALGRGRMLEQLVPEAISLGDQLAGAIARGVFTGA